MRPPSPCQRAAVTRRTLVLYGDTGKLGTELLGIDAIGAHHGADERVVQHLIECQFIVAESHLFFSVFLFAFR